MYIDSLHINTFAGLEEFDVEFAPGLNIIEGGNESGKSTIVAFIKFMFYGASNKEREALASWRSGGAAGTLTFTARPIAENARLDIASDDNSSDGELSTDSAKNESCDASDSKAKQFRIERALVSVGSDSGKLLWRESIQLIDLETGMPCHKGECPGELFFGIDAELFESTAFVSQLGGAEPDHSKASEGIENLLFSADESVDTVKAAAKLDAARVAILHKNEKGGRLYELDNQIAELETRLDSALKISSDIRSKEAQLSDLKASEAASSEKSERLLSKCRQFEARTLVGLFDRMHAAEAKYEALKKAAGITADGGADADSNDSDSAVGGASARELAERIRQLSQQLRELESRRLPVPSTSVRLTRFEKLGGREGVSDMIDSKRKLASIFSLFGIISLIFAIVGIALALIPGELRTVGIVLLVLCALISTVMFILLWLYRREADRISSEFDIDALETELTERETAREAIKLAELSIADINRRMTAAVSESEALVGKQSDIDSVLAALETASRNREVDSGELARYHSIVETMHAQLAGRDEDELRSVIDDSDISDVDMTNLTAVRREANFEAKKAQSQAKISAELEKTLAGLYPIAEDAAKLSDRLGAARLERDRLAEKLAAIKLAQDMLAQASEQLRSSVAPKLAKDASRLLAAITDGKYSELGVGSALDASIATEYGHKSASYMSAGTRDAIYLALRIALCRLVFRKEVSPLICDESFSRLDDKRAARMLTLLGEAGKSDGAGYPGQVLVTTSTRREASLAAGANVIRL